MKKLVFLGSLSFLAFFMLNLSCTKDEKLTVGKTEIMLKDGMLQFVDFKAFSEMYDYLSAEILRTKSIGFKNFTSAEQAYLETNEANKDKPMEQNKINENVAKWSEDTNGEKFLRRVIDNPIYAALFNDKGLIKIGDQILKNEGDVMFIFDYEYIDKIATIQQIPGLQVIRQQGESNLEKNCENNSECSNAYALKNGNQWKKVRGSVNAEAVLLSAPGGGWYWQYTGRYLYGTTHQQRGLFGAWYSNRAETLKILVNGSTLYEWPDTDAITYYASGYCDSEHFATDEGFSGSCFN